MKELEHLFAQNLSWHRNFSENTLQRGKRYAEQGRAEILSHEQLRIEGVCIGSGTSRYQQRVDFSVAPNRQVLIDGRCSCPVALNCKHCAALLFTLAQRYAEDVAKNDTLPLHLEHWLQVLGQPPTAARQSEDRRGRMVCYEILDRDDQGCAVRVRKGTREGEVIRYSRLHSLSELLYDTPTYVKDEDLRILRQLGAQNMPYGQERGFPLKGREGGELLQQIAQTGRLLYTEGGPLLNLGEEREAEFRWVRLDNGEYRGRWHSADAPLHVLPLIPLFYVDTATAQVGTLRHTLDPHTAQQLSIAPDVPEHLIVPLSHKLKALNHQLPTPSTVKQERVDDIQPTAHLTLGSVEFSAYTPKTGRMQRQMQHRAALSFDYDGIRATGNDDKPLSRLVGSVSQRIARQPKQEKHVRETLRINLNEVHDWYATVEEAPAHEWFELELGIVVDGQRHSLLPIILQLLRSNPELLRPSELARRSDEEHLLLDLNRGGLDGPAMRVALPYGRIKAVMGTLGELYLHEGPVGSALRLERADVARLNDIEHLPLPPAPALGRWRALARP